MKNLQLNISSAETTEACMMQIMQVPDMPAPVCLDMVGHLGAIWVVAGDEDVARRIAVCVNTCNDLATETLASMEVREVIAGLAIQNKGLLDLLKKLADNACEIEHDSYSLEGHEHFDVGAVIAEVKAVLAAAEFGKVVQA